MSKSTLRPRPSIFLKNLRHMGYTIESAVADIIDNSISAGATKVSVRHRGTLDSAWLAICDNGVGMSCEELQSAMQFGSRTLDAERNGACDLGRFGLGLKVASLSQCRKLTVFSQKNNELWAACWDIDSLDEEWLIDCYSAEEINNAAEFKLFRGIRDSLIASDIWNEAQSSGTVVLWENLDKEYAQKPTTMNHAVTRVRQYAELVFHRFLGGEDFGGIRLPQIALDFNGASAYPRSPFGNEQNINRRRLAEASFEYKGRAVRFIPFILPADRDYPSGERERDALSLGFTSSQGFYVYRCGRLISQASWFGIIRKDATTQKLRILLDLSADLDQEWGVDVRKSQIDPPKEAKEQLKLLLSESVSEARRSRRAAYNPLSRMPGRRQKLSGWDILPEPEGLYAVRFIINKENPVYKELMDKLPTSNLQRKLDAYLQLLTESLPIAALYTADRHDEDNEHDADAVEQVEIKRILDRLKNYQLTKEELKILLYNKNMFKPENIDKLL